MDNTDLFLFLVMSFVLFPALVPILGFFICFYLGFKFVCRDIDIEIALRDYLARKIRKIFESDSESSGSE